MTPRSRLLVAALVIVMVAGLALRLSTIFHLVEEDVKVPGGVEAQRNPLLAAHLFLERRGIPSTCLDRLDTPPPPGGVLLLGTRELALPDALTDEIVAWVRAGGVLIGSPCEEPGWTEEGSTGARLLSALDVKVQCLVYEVGEAPEPVRVLVGAPAESLTMAGPWFWMTDLRSGGDPALRTTHDMRTGEGRLLLVGDARIFRNDRIREMDHARLLERLIHQGDPARGVWLVYDMGHVRLFALLWRGGWPAILSALAALGLFLWRAGSRFGPIVPAPAPGSRSVMDHVEAVGALLWKRRPEALLAAARSETLRRAARRRPDLMNGGPAEIAGRLATVGQVNAAVAARALSGPEPATTDEFTRAMAALESIRRSL
jgi:hypothetical protein